MRNALLLVVLAGFGCGDDSASGGAGASGGSGGSGATTSQGGNGAQTQGGSPAVGGGGSSSDGGANPGGGGPGPGFSCDAPTGQPPALQLTEIASVGGSAVQVKSPPGAPTRLFIVNQDGIIRIVDNGVLVDTPFLDVSDLIRGGSGSEEGLLGLAFHPDYDDNGRFFIHYSHQGNGDSTIMEYHVSGDPLVADPNPVQLVLQTGTDEDNHNGGAVEFGNDGYLYISMGDGGDQGDPGCDAMKPTRLLGKISRVDVDGTPDANGYPAAPGNPNNAKYYHMGLRNPWRMSFDACTGDLYIGDVGQDTYEEVDAVTAAAGPQNFGWPVREGLHPYGGYDGSCINPPATPTDPISEYDHGSGCAVVGGYVYRGSAMVGLRGWYFFSDNCSGAISILQSANGALTAGPASVDLDVSGLAAFGQDGNGEVYAASTDGTVYRIDPG